MRWVLRLITTGDDARCLSTDLIEICRPEGLGDIANLGLTLPEAKQLLASIQRAVVSGQADSHGLQRPCCPAGSGKCHLKDWRGHRIGTLYGEVTVGLPRFRCTACNRIATSVGWPSRCRSTPELDQRLCQHSCQRGQVEQCYYVPDQIDRDKSLPLRLYVSLRLLISTSQLPSFSDGAESIGEYRKLGEHGSELLDQWQQSQVRHGWDQFVEHAALAEQRMGALLGGV